MSYGAEIVELSELFFKDDIEYNGEARTVLEEEQVPEVLRVFAEKLEHLDSFTADESRHPSKPFKKKQDIKGKSYLCRSA